MKLRRCDHILLLLLAFLRLIRSQNIGGQCQRSDGTRGTCQEIGDCISQGGDAKGGRDVILCSSSLTRIVVCCRKTPANIAKLKCEEWKNLPCTATTPLVRAGEAAREGEFPHMVSILQQKGGSLSHICGGVLISQEYVLTAAHCLQPNNEIYLRLGGHDHQIRTVHTKDMEVLDPILHDGYIPPKRYNDIALLKLKVMVPFSNRIRPACLPSANRRLRNGEKFVVAGWGSYNQGVATSNILRKADVSVIERLQCDKNRNLLLDTLKYPSGITNSIICADETVAGACKGDSGGPLMRKSSFSSPCHPMEVVGLVSLGIPECKETTVPGIYTNIEYYLDWIVDTVWRDEVL